MKNKRKIALSGVIALAVLTAMLVALPSALAQPPYDANSTYFMPEDSTGDYCQNDTIMQVRFNVTNDVVRSVTMDISFDPNCLNVTAADFTNCPLPDLQTFVHHGGWVMLTACKLTGPWTLTGDNLLANITLHCVNDTSDCTSSLNFTKHQILNASSTEIPNTEHNGTIDCTGAAGPINVHIRADGIAGNIFDVSSYSVNPGTVTEDGIPINNQTAMGAMVVYCQENGINVNITTGYWGEYVIQIGDNASDYNSWMYAVDDVKPRVGGAAYSLSGGERVHWYNADYHYYEVYTTLDKASIYPGDDITATVTWRNTTGTHPLNGASINETDTLDAYGSPTTGALVGTTGPDGNCTFQHSTPGVWYVYAVDPVHGSGQYNWPTPYYDCLPEPDLEITDKSEEWVDLANKAYNVTYTVCNLGEGDAGASNTTITIDGVDVLEDPVPALAAGESYTNTIGPFTMSGDNDTIKVCADKDNVVSESNEDNNCLENEFGNPGMPDLEITAIRTEIKVGKKFNTTIIYYNITNNGDTKAGRSVSNLTVDGIEQKKKGRVHPLAPGKTLTRVFRYRSATPPTTIMVCADYNNRIAESNETNNCLAEPYP